MKKIIVSLFFLFSVSLVAMTPPVSSKEVGKVSPSKSPTLSSDRIWRYIKDKKVSEIQKRLAKIADKNMVNAIGDSLLHAAVGTGDLEVVKAVLDGGVDVNIVDFNGQTALHVAAYEGNAPIVALLIDRGAIRNKKDNDGNRPSDLAVQSYGHKRDKDKIKHLLMLGSQVSTETETESQ